MDHCLRCPNEVPADYPVCKDCEPFAHFTHRPDCKCTIRTECVERRMIEGRMTSTDHTRAVIAGGFVVQKIAA